MDIEPLISFIMPVYNSEKRLNYSIESVLDQEYINIELILVNDGSSDDSLNICKIYSKKDKRIKIFSQKNRGVSAARNKGIKESIGEFIIFIDSDDTIKLNLVSEMIKCLTKTKTDMIIFGMSFDYYESTNFRYSKELSIKEDLMILVKDIKDYFFELYDQNYLSSACNKFFSSEVIKKNKIFFEEKMAILEDFKFVLDYIESSKNIVALEEIYYHYYNDSLVNSIRRRPDIDYKINFNILDNKLREFVEFIKLDDDYSFYRINEMILRQYMIGIEKLFLTNSKFKNKYNKFKQYILDKDLNLAAENIKTKRIKFKIIVCLTKKKRIKTLYLIFSINSFRK